MKSITSSVNQSTVNQAIIQFKEEIAIIIQLAIIDNCSLRDIYLSSDTLWLSGFRRWSLWSFQKWSHSHSRGMGTAFLLTASSVCPGTRSDQAPATQRHASVWQLVLTLQTPATQRHASVWHLVLTLQAPATQRHASVWQLVLTLQAPATQRHASVRQLVLIL